MVLNLIFIILLTDRSCLLLKAFYDSFEEIARPQASLKLILNSSDFTLDGPDLLVAQRDLIRVYLHMLCQLILLIFARPHPSV